MSAAFTATIAIAGLALAGCADSGSYQTECVNIASGERLTNTDNPSANPGQWGFTGTDKDGFQRRVLKQDVGGWKCRMTRARGEQ